MLTKKTILGLLLLSGGMAAEAQEETIDISGNNTSSSYVTYDKAISLPQGKTVNVKMARYCYFSSTITGKGVLNLYAGGERCYLGTANDSWRSGSNPLLYTSALSKKKAWYAVRSALRHRFLKNGDDSAVKPIEGQTAGSQNALHGAALYDMSGRRILSPLTSNLRPGLYMTNGKKFIIK